MVYINSEEFKIEKNSVVTLGKFDGVHLGHQKLLAIVKEEAVKRGAMAVAFTFDHMPPSIAPVNQRYVMTNLEKRNKICELGIDTYVEYPFSKEFMDTPANDFVKNVLVSQLKVCCVVVGTDFAFGKDKTGNSELLTELGQQYGFDVIVVQKEKYEDRDISSTYLREELCVGHMETVNMLLGRPYSINGIVARGNQFGRKIGLPTINIYPMAEKMLPPNGVYASITKVGDKNIYGVTNVGIKPTVSNDAEISVETHLFDFEEDLYGKCVEVCLRHFQRPETCFEGEEALQKQIMQDVDFAKELFLLK